MFYWVGFFVLGAAFLFAVVVNPFRKDHAHHLDDEEPPLKQINTYKLTKRVPSLANWHVSSNNNVPVVFQNTDASKWMGMKIFPQEIFWRFFVLVFC